ncbi:hypothetical protein [Streptomyces sp. SAS_270]|uniref:hypothetical protein n=1 Tax=Streptomyces sp. SAS_270 TaxID=3412748 RepID=UPI00403D14E5
MRRVAEAQGLDPKTIKKNNPNVQRWESGTTPERSTQLAIARIHNISADTADQLGWPDFLALADSDALLTAPWTPAGCAEAFGSLRRTVPPKPQLVVTGRALKAFSEKALAATARTPTPTRGADGRYSTTADMVEATARVLDTAWRAGDPLPVLWFAQGDLHTAFRVLAENGSDTATRMPLLLTAAHIAHICCNISRDLGEDSLAEQYGLLAVRAAAGAGSPLHTAACLITLAWHHAEMGDPRDARHLINTAQELSPYNNGAPRLAAIIHAREARVHAQLKNVTASTQALDRAAKILTDSAADDATPWGDHIGEEWLSRSAGKVWLDLGQPKTALQFYSPLIDDPPSRTSTQPLLYTAKDLLNVVEAQLALDEIDAAVGSARRAADMLPRMPAGLTRQYLQHFLPHHATPVVRDLLEELAGRP